MLAQSTGVTLVVPVLPTACFYPVQSISRAAVVSFLYSVTQQALSVMAARALDVPGDIPMKLKFTEHCYGQHGRPAVTGVQRAHHRRSFCADCGLTLAEQVCRLGWNAAMEAGPTHRCLCDADHGLTLVEQPHQRVWHAMLVAMGARPTHRCLCDADHGLTLAEQPHQRVWHAMTAAMGARPTRRCLCDADHALTLAEQLRQRDQHAMTAATGARPMHRCLCDADRWLEQVAEQIRRPDRNALRLCCIGAPERPGTGSSTAKCAELLLGDPPQRGYYHVA